MKKRRGITPAVRIRKMFGFRQNTFLRQTDILYVVKTFVAGTVFILKPVRLCVKRC